MKVHGKYLKWIADLGHEFCETLYDMTYEFKNIYKVTNIAKYRSFQFRLIHRALVTNILLCKWGMMSSDQCSFCGMHTETIIHLLCECVQVKELWKKVLEYIEKRYGYQLDKLSNTAIIQNRITSRASDVENFICLITKQFIYSQRCLKKPISFCILEAKMKHIENVEKYIAIKNGKLNIHERKWNKVLYSRGATDGESVDAYIERYVATLI